MENRDVAIVSCHDKTNFGSVLQAYATQYAIQRLGFNGVTVNKRGLGKDIARGRTRYYASHLLDVDLYKAKLGFVGHRLKQKLDSEFKSQMRQRGDAFRRFELNEFELSQELASFDQLESYLSSFDSVVVGSDQLWLPVNIDGDYFTLTHVPQGVRKISYSTSFGVSELSKSYLEKVGRFLQSFSCISVREETGRRLVEEATGNTCEVVCDPTMLMSKREWAEVAKRGTGLIPDEPYILCYFMGNNQWNRECAIRYARNRNLKIVAIAHPDEYVSFDADYADYYPWSAGPAEWVGLVDKAEAVFTDSFHGTVFSNIFHSKYFVFRRHKKQSAQSTNSRLDTLLDVLGVPERICESVLDFDRIESEEIDFEKVQVNIDSYVKRSEAFLKGALEG